MNGLKMTIEEALKYFNSGYDLCLQLGIAHTNMVRWKKQNFIPVAQQVRINQILGKDMPIDVNKKAMEDRLNKL
jgi:hypothetical protein